MGEGDMSPKKSCTFFDALPNLQRSFASEIPTRTIRTPTPLPPNVGGGIMCLHSLIFPHHPTDPKLTLLIRLKVSLIRSLRTKRGHTGHINVYSIIFQFLVYFRWNRFFVNSFILYIARLIIPCSFPVYSYAEKTANSREL